jgi:hypothetical protein
MRLLPFLAIATLGTIVAAQDAGTGSGATGNALTAEPALRGRLRTIRFTTGDIFDEKTKAERPLAALVDALHWTTREEVVRRELWFAEGDVVDASMVAELERNLRALGLFAEARARLVPTEVAGEVDLEVTTRDRLSITFGGGASFVGGVTGVRAAIGESNLLGYGNRLVGSFAESSDGEYRGTLVYSDLHVLDTWHTGGVRLSRTDDGDSIGFELQRPFKHLADPRSYGVALAHDELATDFFRNGDSVAEVPELRSSLTTDLLWASGPREHRDKFGFVLTALQRDYEPARGVLAPAFRVPGDTDSVFFGPTWSTRWIQGFRKVKNVDTLDFVQDVVLGASVAATIGARWRAEDGQGAEVQPEASLEASWATEPFAHVLTNVAARGGGRWTDAGDAAWRAGATARAFLLLAEWDTLATFVDFDAVEETQDLAVELTLGEDNGLRGYGARQFAGTRRLRAIVENRLDTGIEVATLRLGLVAFADFGQTGTDGDLGPTYRSVGAGLRIGSRPLLGDGVFRVDFAKPLDDVIGENDGWKVSLTVGQVFTFGGNTTVAGTR